MQQEYLNRLDPQLQIFISEVERRAGLAINVKPDIRQNHGGSTGLGKLAVNINSQRVEILAPTTGYFPDGAVRHEVLHIQRFHVARVPKLVLADDIDLDQMLSAALVNLDNAIEHLVIVPRELEFHPDRRAHWEAMMTDVSSNLPGVPEFDRPLHVCLHWTFLKVVLPDSPSVENMKAFAIEHGLLERADDFANRIISVLPSKEETVSLIFYEFPDIPKTRAALEYLNSTTGSTFKEIA